jgi:hypothetical protein
MATVTPGITFISGETVTPAKLNAAAAPSVAVTDNEITTSKILDANVTDAKLATGIDASKLTTGTLPIARIADGAVTNDKLSLAANAGEIKKALNADNAPPIFACRAWVLFDAQKGEDGNNSSDNTNRLVLANGNVSSVKKEGSGDYTVNFAAAMPSVNYCFSGSGDNDEINNGVSIIGPTRNSFEDGFKTTSCQIRITSGANNNRNPNRCSVMFFA